MSQEPEIAPGVSQVHPHSTFGACRAQGVEGGLVSCDEVMISNGLDEIETKRGIPWLEDSH
jgi:hypothetical protein